MHSHPRIDSNSSFTPGTCTRKVCNQTLQH